MNQATFHTETHNTLRDPVDATRKRLGAAMRGIKFLATELIVIGAMALAALVLKLVQIAVANPAVADALTSGRLFF